MPPEPANPGVAASSPRGRAGQRFACALALVALALFAGELGLRAANPKFLLHVAAEVAHPPWEALHPDVGVFALDPQLSFVPVIGGNEYDAYGIRHNRYVFEKPPGIERIVFLGDSATKRGKIVNALREEFGEQRYEYWNAGVEAYNTWQELRFYERYPARASPDHVILIFHLGDYEVQPLCWIDRNGWLVAVHPMRPPDQYDETLMKYSWVYRAWLAWRWSDGNEGYVRDSIREALRELRDLCARQRVRLSVLLLPVPFEEVLWPPFVVDRRAAALSQFRELELRHFDLSEPLRAAVAAGVNPLQDPPGDPLHPSKEVSAYFVRYLNERGLLAPR